MTVTTMMMTTTVKNMAAGENKMAAIRSSVAPGRLLTTRLLIYPVVSSFPPCSNTCFKTGFSTSSYPLCSYATK